MLKQTSFENPPIYGLHRTKKVAAAGRLRLWHKIPPSDPNPSSRPFFYLRVYGLFYPIKAGGGQRTNQLPIFLGKEKSKKVVVAFQGYFDVPRPPFWEKDFFLRLLFWGGNERRRMEGGGVAECARHAKLIPFLLVFGKGGDGLIFERKLDLRGRVAMGIFVENRSISEENEIWSRQYESKKALKNRVTLPRKEANWKRVVN